MFNLYRYIQVATEYIGRKDDFAVVVQPFFYGTAPTNFTVDFLSTVSICIHHICTCMVVKSFCITVETFNVDSLINDTFLQYKNELMKQQSELV